MIHVEIADRQSLLTVDRRWLRGLVKHALRAEGCSNAQLSIALLDNRAIHELNRQYLGHDYPTDVITFPLSEEKGTLHGEIVVSTEFALDRCADDQWPADTEVGLYVVHGVLHLVGYDDKKPASRRQMQRRQRELLLEYHPIAREAMKPSKGGGTR